jgi:uncharacterized membrane protein
MLAGTKGQTNIRLVVGFVLLVVGQATSNPESGVTILSALATIAGLIVWVMGCASYAKGKGYHPALGFLGLFSLIGLLVLFFFPDKYKCCETGGVNCKHGAKDASSDRYSRAA